MKVRVFVPNIKVACFTSNSIGLTSSAIKTELIERIHYLYENYWIFFVWPKIYKREERLRAKMMVWSHVGQCSWSCSWRPPCEIKHEYFQHQGTFGHIPTGEISKEHVKRQQQFNLFSMLSIFINSWSCYCTQRGRSQHKGCQRP